MMKTFKYKEIEIDVKTNWTKNGELYFGEKDIRATLENSVKNTKFNKTGDSTNVSFLIDLYNRLKKENIKAEEIRYVSLKYKGSKMTDMSEQQKVEEFE